MGSYTYHVRFTDIEGDEYEASHTHPLPAKFRASSAQDSRDLMVSTVKKHWPELTRVLKQRGWKCTICGAVATQVSPRARHPRSRGASRAERQVPQCSILLSRVDSERKICQRAPCFNRSRMGTRKFGFLLAFFASRSPPTARYPTCTCRSLALKTLRVLSAIGRTAAQRSRQ